MARTSTTATETKVNDNIDLAKENAELRSQLSVMMDMIKELQKNQVSSNVVTLQDDFRRRVTITSITTGGINLKTNDYGSAKLFRLSRFGQTIPIVYEDLMDCINTDRWIFEEGLVYINDEQAIKEQYLEEAYQKFLTQDKISDIMKFADDDIANMVSNATREIQETIVKLICTKINNNETVNLNKIRVVGDSCTPPIDILDLAKKLA